MTAWSVLLTETAGGKRLVHFVLSILACQELRRKEDDDGPYRAVVTVRYDGVGPDGTARPLSCYQPPGPIRMPEYAAREAAAGLGPLPPPIAAVVAGAGARADPRGGAGISSEASSMSPVLTEKASRT